MTQEHKHYKAAYNAFRNTSFTPDKRAAHWCEGFDNDVKTLEAAGVTAERIARYESLFLRHLAAKSRCASTMIVGRSGFNTARNDKALRSEHKAANLLTDYYHYIIKDAQRKPEDRPIMAGDENAIDHLKEKLEQCRKNQETMKAINVAVRKSPIDRAAIVSLLGSEERADEILKPDYAGRIGFAGFSLSNNLAEIKRLQGRIKEIESRKASTPKEFEINGVKIKENTEAMRLQIFFNGKPDQSIIAILKKNAFKWAPSVGAWQRQLNGNAVFSFNHYVLPALKGA